MDSELSSLSQQSKDGRMVMVVWMVKKVHYLSNLRKVGWLWCMDGENGSLSQLSKEGRMVTVYGW